MASLFDTTTMLLLAGLTLVGAGLGWFASARVHQRRIDALTVQHKAARQTEADRAQQVKRQIAQLQAELAARPPARSGPAAPTPVADTRTAADAVAAAAARRAAVDKLVPDHGFAPTAIAHNGFATTEVME